MMRNFKFILTIGFLLLIVYSCHKDNHSPLDNDRNAPKPVTNPLVESIAGGAKITYTLPDDIDLLYVEAEFQIREGTIRRVKASIFDNSLIIDGFGDTSQYEVKLYSVDRSENRSLPVTVQVVPLLPPVQQVYNSLTVIPDFGGIYLSFENLSEANIVINVFAKDSIGHWVSAERYYTKNKQGSYSARGFESKERQFGIVVSDRWSNHSDTAKYLLTPLFEEEIDKSKFKIYFLPGDTKGGHSNATWTLDKIWDDVITTSSGPVYHTAPGTGMPQWCTFDMGIVAKLSRFKAWSRLMSNMMYNAGSIRKYEIWGCSTTPPADGNWTGWTKLMDCEAKKPSELPLGIVSNDDVLYAQAGEDFTLPRDTPPVRYIRIKTLETWGKVDYVFINEFTFWGSVQ
jgi:hypothetical protein